MRDAATKWPPAGPRWGTFSVRAHTDTRRLITDVLLYDMVVFPSPSSHDEADRWDREGWDVELLTRRVVQLGPHAAVRPWDNNLRLLWRHRFDALAATAATPQNDLAFDVTAQVLAQLSFLDLLDQGDVIEPSPADDRMYAVAADSPPEDRIAEAAADPPEIHPALSEREVRAVLQAGNGPVELVAAFQDTQQAQVVTGVPFQPAPDDPRLPDRGVRLRLEVDVPDGIDEESTFLQAVRLLENDDFRAARRRLWSWEQTLPNDIPLGEAQARLTALLNEYNEVVKREVSARRTTAVFLVTPAAIGVAADLLVGGLGSAAIGLGTSVVLDRVKLKFPILNAASEATHHPGSAIAGALAVVAHD